ncbi:peptide-methionine (S)-S-oxide reductase MsrA [Cucumibacter marinus]|uniref:peptide-methionine (S)-S-oxide reductase MsrA n=1 Tax=Cucumibacter marinus TaxID=1121252 RepID=UPI000426F86C|nr:peptide-methionine (S)-S-oxide reductase MsrA [Cucumibacter marinus]
MTVRLFRPFIIALMALMALAAAGSAQAAEKAIFAGGCFWCVEADFDKVPGVTKTVSGYIGGDIENPTYEQVSHGNSGHYEAVEVTYDPSRVTYEELLTAFWHSVDPTDPGGQFCDRGDSYKTAIFAIGPEQLAAARASKAEVQKDLTRNIVTRIIRAPEFYPAEGYHQNYYKTNAVRYNFYRSRCGRDDRVRQVWGDLAYKGIK